MYHVCILGVRAVIGCILGFRSVLGYIPWCQSSDGCQVIDGLYTGSQGCNGLHTSYKDSV